MFQKLRPLVPYLKRYKGRLLWGGLAGVCSNVAWIFFPQVIRAAIDAMTGHLSGRVILKFALLLILVATLRSIFLFLTRWIIIGVSREIEFDLRNDMFAQLQKQPASYFHKNRTGDIMARMTNDLSAVRMLLGPAIMYSANTVLYSIGAVYFLLRISPRLTLFALAPLPLASILVQTMGRKIHERFERIQAMFSDISAQAQENFSGARLVRAFAQEEAQVKAFEHSNKEYIRRSLRLVQLMGMLWPTLEFILGIAVAIALLVGGHEVIRHQISVGDFVAFLTYMFMLTWPIIALGWVVNLIERGTASTVRVHELLTAKPDIDESHARAELSGVRLEGEIRFQNLSFAYDGGPTVLHNINLTIPAGSSLAIVGPTGSGKTTLVSLIPRLYEAAYGSLRIDEQPIEDYDFETLRSQIGFVPQESFLFSTTIAENISLGAPNATHEQIMAAAEAAHIRAEFELFPQGFETMVGERGITLSGGQKQRASLARAILRHPRILILDDALASVDTQTEEQILTHLSQVMEGRTTILISHRVSTVRHADRIAVLAQGEIVEYGTHDELMTRKGYYAELHHKQQLEEELTVTL